MKLYGAVVALVVPIFYDFEIQFMFIMHNKINVQSVFFTVKSYYFYSFLLLFLCFPLSSKIKQKNVAAQIYSSLGVTEQICGLK